MPHPIKKIYKPGSTGANRKKTGITLTQIKRNLKAGMVSRQFYYSNGELGCRALNLSK
jgi:hypothetical protein